MVRAGAETRSAMAFYVDIADYTASVWIRRMQTLNLLYIAWMNGHFKIVGTGMGNKQTHRPIR